MDALVKNAADPEQIEEAGLKIKYNRKTELDDIRRVLESDYGRRFIWRYLGVCRVFESSWSPSAAIHFYEGQRDIGLKLMADITEANDEALILMMRESKKRERKSHPQGEKNGQ